MALKNKLMVMLKRICLLILFALPFGLKAQTTVKGTIIDFESKVQPLEGVTIKNLINNSTTRSKASGEFILSAKSGDLLEFRAPGYHTDTLYLIDVNPKKVYLLRNSIELAEVNIQSAKISPYLDLTNPTNARDFKQVMSDDMPVANNQRAGGLNLSLGYGKYRREQEKITKLEARDRLDQEIRSNFSAERVTNLVKLEGQPLKDFMDMYKPSQDLIQTERPFNYDYYIVKSYHAWLKLPDSQKRLPPVPKM